MIEQIDPNVVVSNVEKHGRTFNFNFIKNYDISKIREIIVRIKEQWREDEWRQKAHSVHEHTESYFINKINIEWDYMWDKIGDPLLYNKQSKREDGELQNLTLDIIEDLEKIFDGKAGHAMFIKLKAGEEVHMHQDHGGYLTLVHRFHIPIITNPLVEFMVGGESKYLQEGECWEINNNNSHYVNNPSEFDRVHLLVDILKNEYIGE